MSELRAGALKGHMSWLQGFGECMYVFLGYWYECRYAGCHSIRTVAHIIVTEKSLSKLAHLRMLFPCIALPARILRLGSSSRKRPSQPPASLDFRSGPQSITNPKH